MYRPMSRPLYMGRHLSITHIRPCTTRRELWQQVQFLSVLESRSERSSTAAAGVAGVGLGMQLGRTPLFVCKQQLLQP